METTPKKAGLLYDARRAVWNGKTNAEIVPADAETLQDYKGEDYRRWFSGGYRWNRTEDGNTTAYRD